MCKLGKYLIQSDNRCAGITQLVLFLVGEGFCKIFLQLHLVKVPEKTRLPNINNETSPSKYKISPSKYQLPNITFQIPITKYHLPNTKYHFPNTNNQISPSNYDQRVDPRFVLPCSSPICIIRVCLIPVSYVSYLYVS